MQRVLWVIVATVFGLNFGALTALWFGGIISGGPTIGNAMDIDGWRSDWSIGSENANPYVRSRVARNGLMGLRKEEAVYFLKMRDDDGKTLREDCTYTVSGGTFPANWWSITLYDGESRLPMNDDQRLSYDQTKAEALFGTDPWRFSVSASAPSDVDAPWVSSRAGGKFDLTLRLYEPAAALLADPKSTLTPPKVERVSCGGEGS
ncbi:MAG: DUF1214 domain-containing protein [Pseudomonadota bacterium]